MNEKEEMQIVYVVELFVVKVLGSIYKIGETRGAHK